MTPGAVHSSPVRPPEAGRTRPAPWGEVGTWRSSIHKAHAWRLLKKDVALSSLGGWLWG